MPWTATQHNNQGEIDATHSFLLPAALPDATLPTFTEVSK